MRSCAYGAGEKRTARRAHWSACQPARSSKPRNVHSINIGALAWGAPLRRRRQPLYAGQAGAPRRPQRAWPIPYAQTQATVYKTLCNLSHQHALARIKPLRALCAPCPAAPLAPAPLAKHPSSCKLDAVVPPRAQTPQACMPARWRGLRGPDAAEPRPSPAHHSKSPSARPRMPCRAAGRPPAWRISHASYTRATLPAAYPCGPGRAHAPAAQGHAACMTPARRCSGAHMSGARSTAPAPVVLREKQHGSTGACGTRVRQLLGGRASSPACARVRCAARRSHARARARAAAQTRAAATAAEGRAGGRRARAPAAGRRPAARVTPAVTPRPQLHLQPSAGRSVSRLVPAPCSYQPQRRAPTRSHRRQASSGASVQGKGLLWPAHSSATARSRHVSGMVGKLPR